MTTYTDRAPEHRSVTGSKNARIRVLVFRPTLGQGGADRVTLTLLEHMDRRIFDLHLALMKREGELVSLVPDDVPVYDLAASSLWTSPLPLWKLLRALDPDVLFSTCSGANMPSALVHRLDRGTRRLVLSERNVLRHGRRTLSRRIQPSIKRLLYPHADCVTTVSGGVAEDLRSALGLADGLLEVVYNPVVSDEIQRLASESSQHPWLSDDIPVVLGAGRLVHQKGFDTLLEAFSRVRTERQARLIILGEGPLRGQLTHHARRLGVQDSVDLVGFVDNPFSFMARATMFVLSSRQEGLPGVLIQAMACGAPAVSTDCPSGPSEIVTDGEDGYLVPVDDVEAMASYMLKILDDPELRRRFSRKAREAAERFRVGPVVQRYERSLLGNRPNELRPG